MSARAIQKNTHRNDFGEHRGCYGHSHDGYGCLAESPPLWKPASDAIRGAAHAPHKDGAKRGGMPFATCVALGVLHSNGKIEDDVHMRLRNGSAPVEEIAAFESLLIEHQIAVAANAERRKQKRATTSSVPNAVVEAIINAEELLATAQARTEPASDPLDVASP
jgi:hypothetical protein